MLETNFTLYPLVKAQSTILVTRTRIELVMPAWEAGVLTAWPTGQFGAPSGTRTQDPLIKSQLLYHLS